MSWTDNDSCLKVDGTCVIDVFHKENAGGDTSTYRQISSAAEKVYGTCVARGGLRAQGGWIGGLGRRYSCIFSSGPYIAFARPSSGCGIYKTNPLAYLPDLIDIDQTGSLTLL